MYVTVQGEIIFIIDCFVEDTPPSKSPCKKDFFVSC